MIEQKSNKEHNQLFTQFKETTPTSGGLSPQSKKGNSLLVA